MLLCADRDELVYWRGLIEHYLAAELGLALNPRERLRPISDGIDFLGYIVRRHYRLARRRVVAALKARLCAYRELMVSEQAGVTTYWFDAPGLGRLRAVLASYLGHFKRANAFNLWQSLWRQHAWLAVYSSWDAASHRLAPRWRVPKALNNVRAQYAWVRGRYPGDALLFQVGAYYELYDRRDAPVARLLGLKPLRENRRRALFGLPERLFGRSLARLTGQGRSVRWCGRGSKTGPGFASGRLPGGWCRPARKRG